MTRVIFEHACRIGAILCAILAVLAAAGVIR